MDTLTLCDESYVSKLSPASVLSLAEVSPASQLCRSNYDPACGWRLGAVAWYRVGLDHQSCRTLSPVAAITFVQVNHLAM